MKKILLAAVMVLLLGTGCSVTPTDGQAAATATAPRPAPTTRAVAEGALTAAAKVVPVQSAVLSLPSGGTIAEVLVAEGDRVQAGQPLVRLDRARATANVAQAQAQLAQAQATYDKLRAGATPEEIAMAEAQLRAAQAQLRQTTGSVTSADQVAAAAQLQQARSHLVELQAGPTRPDMRAAEAQLAQTQANLTTQRAQLSAAKTNAQLQMEQAANALRDRQADYSRIYWDNRAQEDRLARFGQELPQASKDQEAAALRAVQSAEETLKQAQVAYDTARQAEVSGIQAAEQQAASSQASLDKLRGGANAENQADDQLPRALLHDHPENSLRVSTERHPDAELLGALIHGETHHAIESDAGEDERDDAENCKEHRDHAIAGEDIVVELGRCAREIRRKV